MSNLAYHGKQTEYVLPTKLDTLDCSTGRSFFFFSDNKI